VDDNCYRLIGFPEDFQFTHDKGQQGQIRGNEAVILDEAEDNDNYADTGNINQHFNKGQVNFLMHAFKQMKVADTPRNTTNPDINANAVAGTMLKYFGSCFSVFNSNTWIIDSGASEHMCFNPNSFRSMSPLTVPLSISLPNSQSILVTHIGTVSIFSDLTLHNVLYVPSFKYNLLSVHKVCTQFNFSVFFTSHHCLMQVLSMRNTQVFGDAKEGLYLLDPSPMESRFKDNVFETHPQFSNLSSISLPESVSFPVCSNALSDVRLWHMRLGHLPLSSMKNISFISIPSTVDCFCDVCPQARQSRLPFPISQISTKSKFELIHVDTWGPYKVPTYNHYKYFLTIVDDFTRGTWTFLLATKSNALTVLQSFILMVARQFDAKIKMVRSDNAMELGSSESGSQFFASQGIIHQTSCVATPQQNGVVERKHRHLLEIARALLFQSKVPMSFWGECILTATYLINRLTAF